MKWPLITAGVLCFALTQALAQNFNASVSGFAQDPTQAYIPGVTVTATNTATGVTTTAITNESGAYTIASLLPGIYKLTAELQGFKARVFNEVQLGASNLPLVALGDSLVHRSTVKHAGRALVKRRRWRVLTRAAGLARYDELVTWR